MEKTLKQRVKNMQHELSDYIHLRQDYAGISTVKGAMKLLQDIHDQLDVDERTVDNRPLHWRSNHG